MKKKRRGCLIALIVFGAVVVVLVGIMAAAAFPGMGYVRHMTIAPVDLSKVPDGSYQGSFHRGRFQFAVAVTVKGNRIEAIDMTDKAKATAITRAIAVAIIQKQSVAIDAVSGASLSTKAFAAAVGNALGGAK